MKTDIVVADMVSSASMTLLIRLTYERSIKHAAIEPASCNSLVDLYPLKLVFMSVMISSDKLVGRGFRQKC